MPEIIGCQIWAVVGLSHLGDLMFHQKIPREMRCMSRCIIVIAANHQSPIAVAFWIIQIVSAEECSSLAQNLVQICCSACSVTLNVKATQCAYSLNSVSLPHRWVHWSCHCSCMLILVTSLWLPVYTDVVRTVLVILTMAGLFPDRPCVLYQNLLL